MKTLITIAIQERRLIRLTYDGLTKTVEPHLLGINRKKQDALLCWQVWPPMRQAGFWRELPLAGISGLQVLETYIGAEPEGPSPPLDDFSQVYAILQRQ